jgi:hypothetical protein
MASEDSDQLILGCPPIHRLDDFRDLYHTVDIEMPTVLYQPHAARELLKVTLLRRVQRVSLEERNNRSHEILPPIYDELAQVLTVIVLTLVDIDATNAKEALELLERRSAADTLRHDKPMRHLIPSLVASAICAAWLPNKPDGEASLSVHKASDPTELDQSFLLISCTRHIVTVSPAWDETRSAGFSGFPAYSQMLTAQLPVRRAAIHLRTVIVTAAVYRGLASLLRVKP